MLSENIETERAALQSRLDAFLKDGAECLVTDEDIHVTSFYLDGFEILLPQLYFDRQTGGMTGLSWWSWLREIHFESAMQRSHLLHVKAFEWINDRNLKITTDDFTLLICVIDPPDVDPRGNAIWKEWIELKRVNLWLEKVAQKIREEFMDIARRAVG